MCLLEDTKKEITTWLKKNKRKFDDGTEAAYALADKFDIEDELENPNNWIWRKIRNMFGESVDFGDILVNLTQLNDGTKIDLDESMIKRVNLVYGMLDRENQKRFAKSFIINKKNHNTIVEFVINKTKGIRL